MSHEGFQCSWGVLEHPRLLTYCLQMPLWFVVMQLGPQLNYLGQVLIWFKVVSCLKVILRKCEIIPVGEVGDIDSGSRLKCRLGPYRLPIFVYL